MDTKTSESPSADEQEPQAPYNPLHHESTSNKDVVAVLVTLIFTLVLLFVVVLIN